MSTWTITAITEFLKALTEKGQVVSYGYLAKKFNVSNQALVNLLANRLVSLCHVVVGKEGDVYVLSSNKGICEYQIKKLSIPLMPVSSAPKPERIRKRVAKNSRGLSDLRIVPKQFVCEEELQASF